MRENFEPALAFTLSYEGGFVDHPKDPGGATNKGVTIGTLRRYVPGATVADLKAISQDLLRRIYRSGYWDEARCDPLAAGVDGAVFDYAVNSGPSTARKSLDQCLGGPADDTVRKLCKRRLSIYQGLKNWNTFGKGWTRRIAAGEALWVKWALAATPDVAVAKELDHQATKAEKKAATQQTGAAGSAGAGGATAVSPDIAADQLAAWVMGGLLVAAVAVAIFLLWRAHINKERARAYREQATAPVIAEEPRP